VCGRGRLGATAGGLFELADEAVADAREGFDEARPHGVVAQDRAQPLDGGVDAVLEVDRRAVGPQALPDVVTGHHVARAIEHQRQELEALFLQPHGRRPAPHFAEPQVDLDIAKPYNCRGHGSEVLCPGGVQLP
jgi:hypothetical protein